ncbi:tRNA uridine-5-carboxymethylaminomethyl(34) synthesis GTPase MnmE [bacterium]|jgi:tRNA modification GTPase|nr:tRNA uridine-5-carboxymethylaminomethyl(34) synthesis GTPase MnmE [bacterium]MBT3903697.1 tRNA uridine-5-carboxymethylaminomethyl(34) synthesis GTPase MnmE [bacterium]MBT4577583.1 tRNA uridine-5-carboxymethylaminomethyl(34) synthesis GTPase MnmE [bacterium]MBT5345743.1 tRNA uridine-5-carboxymethylaminomethyl(34) synthesis GTPase MnmE [bacterium]MBT6130916.1 tRNA uridine-5-carboxymethylaminomethyl(34) synthesis GTPase MnmE [bacterium]
MRQGIKKGQFLGTDETAVVAQCTPQGAGAIALLRISGHDAISVVQRAAKIADKTLLIDASSHTIHYGWVVDADGTHLDQVLFLLMRAPRTFTGQDTVEITCHNNPFLIERIVARLIACGARSAQEGEFSKRAFLNKKIDLVQAEAINELIRANTQIALKKSLAQLSGSLSSWVTNLEKDIIKALAFCQASLEFLDDESVTFAQEIRNFVVAVHKKITTIRVGFEGQQQVREGVRIAIVGAVNAGKSSLFNRLLAKERAIVTSVAGTTRDTIEAGLNRSGVFWTLVDTAGVRVTDDIIEQRGIERSFAEAARADLIVLVVDGAKKLSGSIKEVYCDLFTNYSHKIIFVRSKVDSDQLFELPEELDSKVVDVSSINGQGLNDLLDCLDLSISKLMESCESPFLLNKRQMELLDTLDGQLESILQEHLQEPIQYELLSYHLQDAAQTIAQVTGRSISEAGMDAIFKEFCIGK